MMEVKCKFCSLPIRWLITTNGKKMPVDAYSRPYWKVPKGKMRIVTGVGEVFACEYQGEGKPDGHGYTPHHGTCSRFKK